jgi:hypothetical protein
MFTVDIPDSAFACACRTWPPSSEPGVLQDIDAAGFTHAIHGLGISMCEVDVVQVWKVPLLC